MKHIKTTTKIQSVPAQASILQTQQKVSVFNDVAVALQDWITAISGFLGLRDQA